MSRLRIAVIGAGISGLSAAWLLREAHDVVLFERELRAGGHADTQTIVLDGAPVAVDTGFIVYNTRNYPQLTALFASLGVATHASDMSFGVSIDDGAFEYAVGTLTQLLARPGNLLRPRFLRMLRDLLRFQREAPALLGHTGDEALGDWLERRGYGRAFVEDHILPMGAAIWSSSVEGIRAFPARDFARFFHNHGLLTFTDQPRWRTVSGGSRQYVARILDALPDVQIGNPIICVARRPGHVVLTDQSGIDRRFDRVVFATHADEALALLAEPTPRESLILSALRAQDNLAVLHTDVTLMPRRRAAWAAWNYLSTGPADHGRRVSLTYWMNKLQGLKTTRPLFVSLNPHRPPAADCVLRTRPYRHPQYDAASMRARADLPQLQGDGGVFYAGAWTGWGFHEDGIAAAVGVAARLGVTPPWGTPTSPREPAAVTA